MKNKSNKSKIRKFQTLKIQQNSEISKKTSTYRNIQKENSKYPKKAKIPKAQTSKSFRNSQNPQPKQRKITEIQNMKKMPNPPKSPKSRRAHTHHNTLSESDEATSLDEATTVLLHISREGAFLHVGLPEWTNCGSHDPSTEQSLQHQCQVQFDPVPTHKTQSEGEGEGERK